jgi:hypothetical protein
VASKLNHFACEQLTTEIKMKKTIVTVLTALVSVSAHAYKCDEARFSACLNKIKPQILASIKGAEQVRIGLSSRGDGFNNLLVTYRRNGKSMMDMSYIQDSPCASSLVTTGELTGDLAENSKHVIELLPEFKSAIDAFGPATFLYDELGRLTDVKSTVTKVGNGFLQLKTAYDKVNHVQIAQVRTIHGTGLSPVTSTFPGETMLRASEVSGGRCDSSGKIELVSSSSISSAVSSAFGGAK